MADEIKSQFLFYDFLYEGIRHRAKIKLEEDCHGVQMLYDKNNLEVTWEKRIRHKGKHMLVNIVLKDDWNDWRTIGQVVASAWICIYNRFEREIIDHFEPDYWSFIDEENPTNNTDKNNYKKRYDIQQSKHKA
ncbi:MAG: hypothetical protein KBS82_07810 [Oscillospiraceae bacterium]|nr:hypothetical protein [Candidatus Limimonas egerieequi]